MEKKRPTEDTERKYDLQKGIREVEATNLQHIGLSSFVRFFRSRGSINNDMMSFEGSPGHHKRIFHCTEQTENARKRYKCVEPEFINLVSLIRHVPIVRFESQLIIMWRVISSLLLKIRNVEERRSPRIF